MSNDKAINISS